MTTVAIKENFKRELKFKEGKRKAVFIIAFQDFRDREYFIASEILELKGVEIKVASNKKGIAIGADGGEVKVDFLISEINLLDFDVIIFIGGPGCLKYLDSEDSYKIIKATIDKGKILASICISPVILAKTGVLKNKRATVWYSVLDKKPIKILKENGAKFIDENVVQDENIITANDPEATEKFANKILESL